jgi:hypothetical protein
MTYPFLVDNTGNWSKSAYLVRHRAHLISAAPQRVPALPVGPCPLANLLRSLEELLVIDALNRALEHAYLAVNNYCLDIVADAAFHQTADRIPHRPVTNAS